MYFQRLFYENGRLYVSKIKDSQQIWEAHVANAWGRGAEGRVFFFGGGG